MPRNSYEFPLSRNTTLPDWVINTGDEALLTDYLSQKKDSLSQDDKLFVENAIKCSKKVRLTRDKALSELDKEDPADVRLPVTPMEGDGIILEGIHQNSFQTSGAGCWSCFLSNALSARGLSFSQEEIRAYRPNISKEVADKADFSIARDMNTDHLSNAYESGDLIAELLPNTLLKEVEISPISGDIESIMSRKEYLDNSVAFLKKRIKDSIEKEHAPVGILINGHFRTIVGIKGDEVYFKDSMVDSKDRNHNNPDMTHNRKLSDLVSNALTGTNAMGIKINYLEDVVLSKDGNTLLNVPSAYVSMKENGEVVPPPKEIQEMAQNETSIRNQKGINIRRFGGREGTVVENTEKFTGLTTDGIIMTERTYIPKTLHAKSLVSQAGKRSDDEEKRLQDKRNYELNNVADKRKISEIVSAVVTKTSYEEVRKKQQGGFSMEGQSRFTLGGGKKLAINVDKVSKDFGIDKEKLEEVKDDIAGMGEILEAISAFKGMTGKEPPKEIIEKAHRLNRAINSYQGGGGISSEELGQLLEVSNKAVRNAVIMQRKQNSAAKSKEDKKVL